MKPTDAALAVLTSVIWGLAFVATKIALDSFSPPQLTALRFLIACLPALSCHAREYRGACSSWWA